MKTEEDIIAHINSCEYKPNPILSDLKRIYQKFNRINVMDGGVIQGGKIFTSDYSELFSDNNVSFELNNLVNGEKRQHVYDIDNKNDFPTSVFDVLLSYLDVQNNNLIFSTHNTKKSIKKLDDILLFKACDQSTFIFHSTMGYFLSDVQLKNFELILIDNMNFMRVHKSYIINLKRFEELTNDNKALIWLDDTSIGCKIINDFINYAKTSTDSIKNQSTTDSIRLIYKVKPDDKDIPNDELNINKTHDIRNFMNKYMDTTTINGQRYFAIPLNPESQKTIIKRALDVK